MTVFFHGVIRSGQYQELMATLQLVAQIHGTHASYVDKNTMDVNQVFVCGEKKDFKSYT